ncbi:MAG: efflux RND transporter periplasmic adaptor subunit, partial [Flavobacteriia bacterium]
VQNIYVEEGQKVKKGQLLFKLETQTLSQDANAAKASVNVAQVEVDKLVPLVEKGIISNVQLETAKAQLEQAKSNYNSITANIGYSNIVSPVNGYIGGIPYKVGALVSSTMAQPLTVVSDISGIRAYFSMNEKELLQMKTQMAANANENAASSNPEVELVMINGQTYPHKGKIAMINNIINPTTGSVSLRADFENPDLLLSSGSTGTIRVPSTYKDVWVIPQFATVDLQGTKMVYVLNGDTVNTKPINIVAQTATEFIVSEGLEEGTTIVTEGVSKLRDGQTINPIK